MKRKWTAFLLTVVAVLLLTGCGEKKRDAGSKATDSDTKYSDSAQNGENDAQQKSTDTSTADEDAKDSSTTGKTSEKTKIDNTVSGSQTPTMNAKGYVESNGNTRSWSQMIDNGLVRDRDGDLLDGENSHW